MGNDLSEELFRLRECVEESIPSAPPEIIRWAHRNVILPSSTRSKHFNISIAPWLREPFAAVTDPRVRIVTLMKPIQSGGSTLGEVLLLYWIVYGRGFIQYNWSNDRRAVERWESRVHGVLKACPPVAEKLERAELAKKGDVDFGNTFLRIQGAHNPDNLDSDSVPMQINEEVHSWEPGHLKKARGRSTAVWNFKSVDISNAGFKGDQLDQAMKDGTMQRLHVKCPGCGQYHIMRTKWKDTEAHLGGLRYDAEGCRRGNFEYDYNKLRPSIRYQFPCGFTIHNEDIVARRQLSASCAYTGPLNQSAELSHRSYTYDSVCVDYIDWMTLIKDKHNALRALAAGDPEPFRRYVCERECIPYDAEDIPMIGVSAPVTKGIVKSREGLDQPRLRLAALDRQAGEKAKDERPYWWLVIRDAKFDEAASRLRSLLVFEGRVDTDDEVLKILSDHGVLPHHVVCDSGDDTTEVYLFCMRNGFNAIKGDKVQSYRHPDNSFKVFSPERPLCLMIACAPRFPMIEAGKDKVPDPREPLFFMYSKDGIRERLEWLRKNTIYETPEDVSEAYSLHMESEQRVEDRNPYDGSPRTRWVQIKKRNDLFVCECYIAMLIDQAGGIGISVAGEKK